jgi:hypothetical protein
MTFVNEFVAEEDIKKYGLDELKAKYDWFAWREGRPEGFQHYWTVDRENEVFLMFAKTVMAVGPSGRDEPTGEAIHVLGIVDKIFEVRLQKHESSSSHYTDSPYRIVWKLVEIEGDFTQRSRVQVLEKLRSSLINMGLGSPWREIPNTIVECLF